MGLNIRSEEVNKLAEKLAKLESATKTDAVRMALEEAIERRKDNRPLMERLQPLFERMRTYPTTGLEADKAFYDSLNDEEDA
jgi:antitoxin VapB